MDYATYYQGLWDCHSDQPDELSFQRGDLIRILSKVKMQKVGLGSRVNFFILDDVVIVTRSHILLLCVLHESLTPRVNPH